MKNKYAADFCPACGHRTTEAERHGRIRPVCPQCGYVIFFDPKVAVIAFITDDEKLLLVQRDVNPRRGLWSLPGGYVEIDESPTDALRREVSEETGLEVHVGDLLGVFHLSEHDPVIVIAYKASVNGGMLNAGDDAAQTGWFAQDQLPELGFASTKMLTKQWLDGEI